MIGDRPDWVLSLCGRARLAWEIKTPSPAGVRRIFRGDTFDVGIVASSSLSVSEIGMGTCCSVSSSSLSLLSHNGA